MDKNIKDSTEIFLEFRLENGENKTQTAKVIDHDEKYDIALLELTSPIEHINDWLNLCSDAINKESEWETIGYPKDWNENDEGTDYCYIDGDIHYVSSFDNQTIYDLHLYSSKIKEDWPYDLGGLSGAPLVIDGSICGIIIFEENSAVKSQLKAISFRKCEDFFVQNSKNIKSTFKSEKNRLLKQRLEMQKNSCGEFFQKIDFNTSVSGINLTIDSYFLKYDALGISKLEELAKYLITALHQYACTLSEVQKLTEDPFKMFYEISQKTKQSVTELHRLNRLGSIVLWMLLEGVLEVPKFLTRFSLSENSNFFNEIHLGMKDNKLVFYLGEGNLKPNIREGIIEIVQLLKDCLNIQDDAFICDNYIFENMDDNHFKKLIHKFMDNVTRDWNDVELEITIFTGYDSQKIKLIEQRGVPGKDINELIKQFYIKECQENHEFITNIIRLNSDVSNAKVNWFILPFVDTSDFEKMIISNF